jgi:hypothetical protein
MMKDDGNVGTHNVFWEDSPKESTNTTTITTEEIESNNNTEASPRQYRKGWRKPRGMPKRPMSSYNLFFQLERERLVNEEEERVFTPEDIDRIAKIQKQKDLSCQKRKHRKSHGKISFSKLARVIADKWKSLDKESKAAFFERAAKEKDEYKAAVEEWARSNKNASRSRASSPTSEFLAQPIESPPACSDPFAAPFGSANSSPEIVFPTQLDATHHGTWDTVNGNTAIDHTTMNTVAEENWIEQAPHDYKPSMLYNEQLEPSCLRSIRSVRSFQSPPRRQLQPRFVPFNPDFVGHSRNFQMPTGHKSIYKPMALSDQHMKYSPASALNNIYNLDVASQSYENYDLSPSQSLFLHPDINSHRPHMKLMRSRSFPLEERNFVANEMMQQQSMLLSPEYRAQSQPNLFYPSEYGNVHDLAGMPLDTLVEVSPGQFIDPNVYNIDTGKPHQFNQRRSTFSGGYNMEENSLTQGNIASNMINQGRRPEYRRRASDMDVKKSFPPMEITVSRNRQKSSTDRPDYAIDNHNYSSPTSSYSRSNPDKLLGKFIQKHHFPNDNIDLFLNEDEEKAALDLVSLSGNQSQRSTFADKSTTERQAFLHHHSEPQNHHSVSISEDRDTSESNDVHLSLNYHEEGSYHTNHWEV